MYKLQLCRLGSIRFMLKRIPERITYAQKKIIALIEDRKLRQWCIDNDLEHSAIYRIGIGEQNPTYKTISLMVHLIPPIEWLFYTDEKLPYKPQLLPQWDSSKKSKFIKSHKYDYKELVKRYGINELSAYNMCVAFRAMPGVAFIRECCKDTNPIDFFIDGEEPAEPKNFSPDRGDIINISGNIVLVLSKKQGIENTNYITCVPIVAKTKDGIELSGTKTKGFAVAKNLNTYLLSSKCQANYIETVSKEIIATVLEEARNVLR